MENELLKIASTQGVWAALSIVLIFYILKTQEKRGMKQDQREHRYQKIISSLLDKLDTIENIKADLEEVKNYILTQKINR